MTASAAPLPRTERLDRLPFTREHGKLVVGSGIGWALDAMDVGLISFVMAALAVQWSLSAAQSWSVGALLVFRFLIGLGLGAELPVASTLVSEFAPARLRGRVVVGLEAFWAVGWNLAALIGYLVDPRSDSGWRWALALGVVPALYAVVVRRGLPESVRFLEMR